MATSSTTSTSTESTTERHEIDPIFKQRIEHEFSVFIASSQTISCETEYEVGRLPRKIDALVTVGDEQERQQLRQGTPYYYLQTHNQIEFKGRRDTLNPAGYHAIRGRKEFFLTRPETEPDEMTVTIVCAVKPRAVITYAKDKLTCAFVKTDRKGYYKTDETPPVYLIVINELPIIPLNYPLLLFASSERVFRAFLQQVVENENYSYQWYALKVRPQLTREVIRMAGLPSSMTVEDLEFLAEDLGPDLMSVISLEDMFKGMNREKTLDFLFSPHIRDVFSDTHPAEQLRWTLDMLMGNKKEDRLRLTDELVRNLTDDIEQIPTFHQTLVEREQRSIQQEKQQTLIRALRRKFSDVPDNIIHQIEQTHDADQLDAWMDQLFDVDTLAEMDFQLDS
ncbi:MAG: DUF4351 domain-containing protein [Chloroflexota bacterium]